MSQTALQHHPTLRQLLNSEAMAEAQVLFGHDLLDRPVVQVVASFSPPPRPGSLVVSRTEAIAPGREPQELRDLAAVVVIRPASSESVGASLTAPITAASGTANPGGTALTALNVDVGLKRLLKLCTDSETPLIVMPSFGEPGQVADDVRSAFLRELKQGAARLHSSLVSLMLDEGLEGLAEEVSNRLNRPVAIETADFKVIASRNMGATPANQQRSLNDEAHGAVKRLLAGRTGDGNSLCMTPIKVGRRLVLPVCLSDAIVGYVSVMVRPNDDLDTVSDYLQAAALAAMVDFSQRRKDGSVFSVTQKSLLKDLLSDRSLSASDQERLERHYGFDLCDGLYVFAVQATGLPPQIKFAFPEEGYITTDVEGTRVYVVPYTAKTALTWQEEVASLIAQIRRDTECSADVKLQLGASRLIETMLDLADAYKEARQALIIGSMVHGEGEFAIGYGDLGVKRLLYLMIDHPEFDRFYEDTLAPLEAYDVEWESELVPSLRVYLQEGANLNSAARALFIHRHTLRYRLEQIADILKVDIDSQEVLLNLQIAFLIRDMKFGTRGKT